METEEENGRISASTSSHKGTDQVENSSNFDQTVKNNLLTVEEENNNKSADLEMVEIVDVDATKKGELKLTLEGLNEEAKTKSGIERGVSIIHLGP